MNYFFFMASVPLTKFKNIYSLSWVIRTNENICFINNNQQPITGSVTVNKGLLAVGEPKCNKIIPTFSVFNIF